MCANSAAKLKTYRPLCHPVHQCALETRGTQVTAMAQPRTIHDFGGFPRALYESNTRHSDLAEEIAALAARELDVHVALDHEWGLITAPGRW